MEYSLDSIHKKNEKLRRNLPRMQCIKIVSIEENIRYCGGYRVVYDDYRYRCRDEASIEDVLNWVMWEEVYIDNFMLIKSRL